MSGGCDRQPDSERIQRSELQAVRANNEELSAMLRSERADHASTQAAHQEAERLLEGARSERDAAAKGLHEALNNCGELATSLGAARRDLQAARDTLSKVSAAVDAVRLAWEGEAAENMIAALDAVDRALRGVPAPASEARQCEACTAANGTATFHAPEEPCDPRECPAPGPWAHEVEARIAALSDRLTTLEERTGFATGTIAGSVQARVSLPIHVEGLDQRVAGIGNGLGGVRDPRTRLHEGDPAKANPFEIREGEIARRVGRHVNISVGRKP